MANNNEVKDSVFGDLVEAIPFVKLYISHRKGEYKEGGKYNYIEVAELNRYGGGEVVKLNIDDGLDKVADNLRLGDVVKCYILFDGLYKNAGKTCINIEKVFDSNLPMPKHLQK